MYFDKVIN